MFRTIQYHGMFANVTVVAGYGMNVFAFIEYARPEVAEIAAAELVSLIPGVRSHKH